MVGRSLPGIELRHTLFYRLLNVLFALFQLKSAESESSSSAGVSNQDTPIRIITTGQEVTTDSDEKTLAEAGFKDNQVRFPIFVFTFLFSNDTI